MNWMSGEKYSANDELIIKYTINLCLILVLVRLPAIGYDELFSSFTERFIEIFKIQNQLMKFWGMRKKFSSWALLEDPVDEGFEWWMIRTDENDFGARCGTSVVVIEKAVRDICTSQASYLVTSNENTQRVLI